MGNEIISSRRGLITGLGALFLAAPAIVRASSLMPISAAKIDLTFPFPPPTMLWEWNKELAAWEYWVGDDRLAKLLWYPRSLTC